MNGPAPTGAPSYVAWLLLLAFNAWGDAIDDIDWLADSVRGNCPLAPVSLIVSVVASTAVLVNVFTMGPLGELGTLPSAARSQLYLMALASYGVPSVNLIPDRSLSVHVMASLVVMETSVWGITVPDAGSWYSRAS